MDFPFPVKVPELRGFAEEDGELRFGDGKGNRRTQEEIPNQEATNFRCYRSKKEEATKFLKENSVFLTQGFPII